MSDTKDIDDMSDTKLAKLEIRDKPAGTELVVDCDHGTTTVLVLRGKAKDRLLTEIAVMKHEMEEGCGCGLAMLRRLDAAREEGG